MSRFTENDLKRLRTYGLAERPSISKREAMGRPQGPECTLQRFLATLPKSYMANSLQEVAGRMQLCKEKGFLIHISMGSHVIKNGLSPYIIDWMKKGYVSTLSFNGSALIHDFELAYCGSTSENVDEGINSGQFGLARETSEFIHRAIEDSDLSGLGKCVGQKILIETPHADDSLLAQAVKLKIPATVHVAFGTDTIHLHPNFSPEKTARASHNDFMTFIASVSTLENGLYFNIGSAVILPEVFLKALSVVRNLGHQVQNFWAVNLDFIRQYRSRRNVLERPTQLGGRAIEILGPHELTIPLLHALTLFKQTP